jgi:hypothetical protein
MKKLITTSTFVLFSSLSAFTQNSFGNTSLQDVTYEVNGMYSHPIKKEKLSDAKSISDIIDNYPAKWISNYISVEILTSYQGKVAKAAGVNDKLNSEQKNILNAVGLAHDVVIDVKYIYRDPVTKHVENNKMHISMTVVPETEAEYVGGYKKMIVNLKEKSKRVIPEKVAKEFNAVKIKFTVNELGEITDAKVLDTSGDLKTDGILLDAVMTMPKWIPAKNITGVNVKQDFVLTVGAFGC